MYRIESAQTRMIKLKLKKRQRDNAPKFKITTELFFNKVYAIL